MKTNQKGEKKMKKYKNNTISKEYRKELKKLTFNWGNLKGVDPLEKKAFLISYMNQEPKKYFDNSLRAEILKQQYYN